jgi:hypothetical protein
MQWPLTSQSDGSTHSQREHFFVMNYTFVFVLTLISECVKVAFLQQHTHARRVVTPGGQHHPEVNVMGTIIRDFRNFSAKNWHFSSKKMLRSLFYLKSYNLTQNRLFLLQLFW